MSRVLAAALSKPSKEKVLLFPITTLTFCIFMCSKRLMKVVLWCQNQDALGWKCALGARNFSELGGCRNHHCARAAFSARLERTRTRCAPALHSSLANEKIHPRTPTFFQTSVESTVHLQEQILPEMVGASASLSPSAFLQWQESVEATRVIHSARDRVRALFF